MSVSNGGNAAMGVTPVEGRTSTGGAAASMGTVYEDGPADDDNSQYMLDGKSNFLYLIFTSFRFLYSKSISHRHYLYLAGWLRALHYKISLLVIRDKNSFFVVDIIRLILDSTVKVYGFKSYFDVII